MAVRSSMMNTRASKQKKKKFLETEDEFGLSDLPDEILIDILERLNSLAWIRVASVCKGWHLLLRRLLPLVAETKQFPYFLTFSPTDNRILLHNPCFASQRKPCAPIKRYLELPANAISQGGASPLDLGVKFGWFAVYVEGSAKLCANIILYSPFTGKYIYLPPLFPCDEPSEFTMTHPPTCSDCVFLVSPGLFAQGRTWINTCRLGDMVWNKHDAGENIDSTFFTTTFIRGRFICLAGEEKLVAFNLADGSWQLLADYVPPVDGDEDLPDIYHFTSSKDDALLVCYRDTPDPLRVECFSVWKYEWAERGWRKMKSLGGQLIFLGSMGSAAVVAAAGELEGFADRIYFHTRPRGYFSLQDGKFHHDPPFDESEEAFLRIYGFYIVPPPLQV